MESLSCLVLKPAAHTRSFGPRLSQIAASGLQCFFLAWVLLQWNINFQEQLQNALSNSPNHRLQQFPQLHEQLPILQTPPLMSLPKRFWFQLDLVRRKWKLLYWLMFCAAGAEVTVASVKPQLEIQASGGTRLVADTTISTCSNQVFDLVALPFVMQDPDFFDKLPTFGAIKSNVQVSAELRTSQGPGTSFLFALSLVEQLFGESVAKEIAELLFVHSADGKPRKEEFNKVDWAVDHTPHVLLPVANGSEETEVVTIIDILRRAMVDVVVASVERSDKVLASQGVKIMADKLIGDATGLIYDLIILPGGVAGAQRLQKSRILKKLLKEQEAAGRICGAVWSSAILGEHCLLKVVEGENDNRASDITQILRVDLCRCHAINRGRTCLQGTKQQNGDLDLSIMNDSHIIEKSCY
ncbi:hypothetical protein DITRI_Ditri08aG0110600 [Diplodiscus trichospermus]